MENLKRNFYLVVFYQGLTSNANYILVWSWVYTSQLVSQSEFFGFLFLSCQIRSEKANREAVTLSRQSQGKAEDKTLNLKSCTHLYIRLLCHSLSHSRSNREAFDSQQAHKRVWLGMSPTLAWSYEINWFVGRKTGSGINTVFLNALKTF